MDLLAPLVGRAARPTQHRRQERMDERPLRAPLRSPRSVIPMDYSVGGDTNGDGASPGGSRDWDSIVFTATRVSSVLKRVEVRFGGAGGAAAG